jgi:hypothetical protein
LICPKEAYRHLRDLRVSAFQLDLTGADKSFANDVCFFMDDPSLPKQPSDHSHKAGEATALPAGAAPGLDVDCMSMAKDA